MQKHHGIVGAKIVVEYVDGTKGAVVATLSSEKSVVMSNDTYVNINTISFNILKINLQELGLPIKGFKTVKYNREAYEVESEADSSTMQNTVVIQCKKVG